MSRAHADQLAGEMAMFLPLILLMVIFNIAVSGIMAMLCFFVCKWRYDKKSETYFHVSNVQCIALSYGIFLTIGFISLGISISTPFTHNQPMIPLILAVCATLAWACAGDWQYAQRLNTEKILLYENKLPFKCSTATECELRERCRVKAVKREDETFIVRTVFTKTTIKEYAAEYQVSESTIKSRKRRLLKKLESN